jgi:dTDP-4-amino-4,6-dideoxygalactose transaminase
MSGIRLIKPYITFAEVEAEFRDIFASGMLTRGKYVAAFRDELARYTGVQHVYFTTSATTALWVCMRLLGVGPGDEVVVSDFSHPASANVVEDLGATPVFADVSPETYNVPPQELEHRITGRTKAVIFVDALGNPTGIHAALDVCRGRGIPLVEDAACAIGSAERGVRCGRIADITCFSFHPRKLVATGEGGAIVTERDDWARWLEVKLDHGARGTRGVGLDFVDFGYNFRLSELQAIMGIKQLAKLDRIVAARNLTRETYRRQLEPLGFVAQAIGRDVTFNAQSLVFRVPETIDRNALIRSLREQGIETTLGTYCLSRTTYYDRRYGQPRPGARRLEDTTLTLPCYEGVDAMAVCNSISELSSRHLRNSTF